jgi:hypothetical protein
MIRTCALAACCLVLPAAAAVAEPAGISPALRAGPGEAPALMLPGSGVQIYTCTPSALQPDAYAWSPTAPDATLYDGGHSIARLATADHWESLDDRSSVSGILVRMQSGGAGNLPWTLMRAYPVGENGMFAGVTSVQRVNTRGGVAPTAGCDETHVGTEARVDFTADYYFYKRAGAG